MDVRGHIHRIADEQAAIIEGLMRVPPNIERSAMRALADDASLFDSVDRRAAAWARRAAAEMAKTSKDRRKRRRANRLARVARRRSR